MTDKGYRILQEKMFAYFKLYEIRANYKLSKKDQINFMLYLEIDSEEFDEFINQCILDGYFLEDTDSKEFLKVTDKI